MIEAATRLEAAWAALRGVPDPEVPVLSVVEFGMVRDVQEDEHGTLVVTLTPTYSGCPATEAIAADVRAALADLAPVRLAQRLDPPWSSDWLSAEAREKLRAYGIAPPCTSAEQQPLRLQQALVHQRVHLFLGRTAGLTERRQRALRVLQTHLSTMRSTFLDGADAAPLPSGPRRQRAVGRGEGG